MAMLRTGKVSEGRSDEISRSGDRSGFSPAFIDWGTEAGEVGEPAS